MKLTREELTQAIRTYARIHGYYQRTVREVYSLFLAAIREEKLRRGIPC